MCVIPQSWTRVLKFQNNMGIKYSDYFAVYPWMLDKNYEHLVTQTLNLFGLHEVDKLIGQPPPALSREIFDMGPLDSPLLEVLLQRWQRAFSTDSPCTDDVRMPDLRFSPPIELFSHSERDRASIYFAFILSPTVGALICNNQSVVLTQA
jgi:hypothetical protein